MQHNSKTKYKLSNAEQRKQQVLERLDENRRRLHSKTRKQFKSDNLYQTWLRRSEEAILLLEEELAILEDPGIYTIFPIAVVADELGFTIDKVKLLISLKEIEATGSRGNERISREELERLTEIGVEELLRLSDQKISKIFEEAVSYLLENDIDSAQKFYERIEARDSCINPYALALELAVAVSQRDFENIESQIGFLSSWEDTINKVAALEYLGNVLEQMKFTDHAIKVIVEQLLLMSGRENFDSEYNYAPKQFGKKLDEEQQQAMYLTTAIKYALDKVSRRKWLDNITSSFKHELSEDTAHEIIKNAIYTALHAQATYEESPSSKVFVDTITTLIPRYWKPAKLIERIPDKKHPSSKENQVGQ